MNDAINFFAPASAAPGEASPAELLSPAAAAELLTGMLGEPVTPRTLEAWRENSRRAKPLSYVRSMGRVRYRRADVRAYAAKLLETKLPEVLVAADVASPEAPAVMFDINHEPPINRADLTDAGRERIAAASYDRLVTTRAHDVVAALRRLIDHAGIALAIDIATSRAVARTTADGLAPADVATELAAMRADLAQRISTAREWKDARHVALRDARAAVWSALDAAVSKRHAAALMELQGVSARQQARRDNASRTGEGNHELRLKALCDSGLERDKAEELLRRVGYPGPAALPDLEELNARSAELRPLIARFEAFNTDRRANLWGLAGIDADLDALVGKAAAVLGLPKPTAEHREA